MEHTESQGPLEHAIKSSLQVFALVLVIFVLLFAGLTLERTYWKPTPEAPAICVPEHCTCCQMCPCKE